MACESSRSSKQFHGLKEIHYVVETKSFLN